MTALLHDITIDLLKQSYIALKRDAAPGIDVVTCQAYGEDLEGPKSDGTQRPLSIWCLEDKIVQQAVVRVL